MTHRSTPSRDLDFEIEILDDDLDIDSGDEEPIAPPTNRSNLTKSQSFVLAIPDDLADHEAELYQVAESAKKLKHSHSQAEFKIEEEEKEESKNDIQVIPEAHHEYVGLVEEKALEEKERKAKYKNKGKIRRRPAPVDFNTAKEIIRIPRLGTKFFSEGYFDTELPDALTGFLSDADYKESITNINECLARVPTMRTGMALIVPTVITTILLLYLLILYNNPPFYPVMVLFGVWCTFALCTVIGFAVYYIFQRELFVQVAKEDLRLFQKGIRLAMQTKDRKSLFIVIEPGEERNE